MISSLYNKNPFAHLHSLFCLCLELHVVQLQDRADEQAIERPEMKMIKWTVLYSIRRHSKDTESRDELEWMRRRRLWWVGHVMHEENKDCMKRCTSLIVEGCRPVSSTEEDLTGDHVS